MSNKVCRWFDERNYEQFAEFLLDYEEDIANNIADYGRLEGVFIDIFERRPDPGKGF